MAAMLDRDHCHGPAIRRSLAIVATLTAALLWQPAAAVTITFADVNPDSSTLDPTDPDGASGGRINSLATVAGDNQVFYAASEWGGLYKSVDGGLTWSRLDGHLPVATWDVAVDPFNPGTVYATSFYDGRIDSNAGIQLSSDAGASWSHPLTAHPDPALEGGPNDNTPDPGFSCLRDSGEAAVDPDARRVEPAAFGISIAPDASQNVFIGTNCGLAISNDAGATWRFVDPSPADPADNIWDVVAQAGGIVDVCGDDGHLRSPDGGLTWTAGTGLPSGRCSLAVSPDEPYVLFAAAADNNLYESDDGGTTWTNMGTPDARRQGRTPFVATNQRSGDSFDLWYGDVSLYRGGCTTPAMPAPGGAARCPAGNMLPTAPPPAGWAGPFTRLGTVPAPAAQAAHDDAALIVFDSTVATDACPMLFASDGGVYRNTDLGAGCQTPSWEQPNVTPHALWVYGMDGADQAGDLAEDLYFGAQDDGTFAATDAGAASPTWMNIDCCDSFDIVADTLRVISTLCCGFSTRVGAPGMVGNTTINNPPGGVPAFNFPDYIAQFGTNQYIAVTNQGGFITTDITASPVVWTQLGAASTPLGGFCAVHAALDSGTPTFYAQTFCVTSTNSIFEVPGSSQLWKFTGTDPTGAWQRVDSNGLTGGLGVVAVAFDDANRLYASNLAPGAPQMVFSDDGGNTWNNDPALDGLMTGGGVFQYQSRRGPTPQPRFNGYPQPSLLAFDPSNADVIVAGGRDSGVFLSVTGGEQWLLLTDPITSGSSGVPHLPRPWFAYFDREPTDAPGEHRFFVGTQGRGVWRVQVVNQPPSCDADGPYQAECTGPTTPVMLDGGGSSDPDGDPLEFTWTGAFVGGSATGQSPTVEFPGTGMFAVDLRVSDGLEFAMCSANVDVLDTTPPTVEATVAQSSLWSPAHSLIDVGYNVTADDLCSGMLPIDVQVFADEDDEEPTGDGRHSPDAKQDPALRLRAERVGGNDGRVYLILATAADPSGNVGHACTTVVVPKSQSAADMTAVQAQAAAALAFCEDNTAAPPGFFPVGDGPVLGPKQ